jgi:hypothetical protein
VAGLRRLSLIMALLLQIALLRAALPAKPDEAPAPPSLAGELLIAAPEMGDPRFERIRTAIGRRRRSASTARGVRSISSTALKIGKSARAWVRKYHDMWNKRSLLIHCSFFVT